MLSQSLYYKHLGDGQRACLESDTSCTAIVLILLSPCLVLSMLKGEAVLVTITVLDVQNTTVSKLNQ